MEVQKRFNVNNIQYNLKNLTLLLYKYITVAAMIGHICNRFLTSLFACKVFRHNQKLPGLPDHTKGLYVKLLLTIGFGPVCYCLLCNLGCPHCLNRVEIKDYVTTVTNKRKTMPCFRLLVSLRFFHFLLCNLHCLNHIIKAKKQRPA